MDAEDGGLRSQPETLADFAIAELLCFDFVRHLAGEQFPGDPIGRRVKPLHDRLQSSGLVGIGEDLYLQGDLHAADFRRKAAFRQYETWNIVHRTLRICSSPWLKPGESANPKGSVWLNRRSVLVGGKGATVTLVERGAGTLLVADLRLRSADGGQGGGLGLVGHPRGRAEESLRLARRVKGGVHRTHSKILPSLHHEATASGRATRRASSDPACLWAWPLGRELAPMGQRSSGEDEPAARVEHQAVRVGLAAVGDPLASAAAGVEEGAGPRPSFHLKTELRGTSEKSR